MELCGSELLYSKEETISEDSSLLTLECEGSAIEDDASSSDLLQMMDLELENATMPSSFDDISPDSADKENNAPNRSAEHRPVGTDSFLNCLMETSLRKWRCLRKPEKDLRQAILLKKIILRISDLKKHASKKRRLEDSRKEATKKRSKSKTLPVKPWEE